MHVIEQFNGGMYDTIIASDEKFLSQENDQKMDEDEKSKNSKKNPKK